MRRRRGGRRQLLLSLVALAVLVWWQVTQAGPDGGTDGASGSASDAGARADAPGAAQAGWQVTQVIDGDTIEVSRDGVVERVRLLGIDTPERDQCGYAEATALAADLVTGREVTLVVGSSDDRDRYERLLRFVEVSVDGVVVDVGLRQLEAGLAAEVYDSRTGYARHDREEAYIAADEAAADVCPDLREH
ncbi:thermonuclease family protein [Actinotalea fermentans]|nr:thermonuclease family protein [Actinotalea fermentans]